MLTNRASPEAKGISQISSLSEQAFGGCEYDATLFRNRYTSNTPQMVVEYVGLSRAGLAEMPNASSGVLAS
jgi:hypothetical protein